MKKPCLILLKEALKIRNDIEHNSLFLSYEKYCHLRHNFINGNWLTCIINPLKELSDEEYLYEKVIVIPCKIKERGEKIKKELYTYLMYDNDNFFVSKNFYEVEKFCNCICKKIKINGTSVFEIIKTEK